MSTIRKKSEENIQAARLLAHRNMLAASIHCAYYSCFQLSKYMLKLCCGLSYEQQDEESKGKDSHYYIVDKLSDYLNTKSHLSFIEYIKYIAKLKRLRKKADYTDMEVTEDDAWVAIKSANKTIALLKIYFITQ